MEKKRADEMEKEDGKVEETKKKEDAKVKDDEDKIEKEEEQAVDKELNGKVGDRLDLVNTSKLESEISQLDQQFNSHVQQNAGLVLKQPEHISKLSFGENDEHLKNNAIVGGYVGKFLVKKPEEPHQRKQKIQLENDTVEESPAQNNNNTTNNNNVKVEFSANDTKNMINAHFSSHIILLVLGCWRLHTLKSQNQQKPHPTPGFCGLWAVGRVGGPQSKQVQ